MWQRIGRVATILLICSLVVVYFSMWTKSFNDPDELQAADFIHFYAAGQIAQENGYTQIYDLDLQRKIQNQIKGVDTDLILLYNHLPYFVPVLAWIVDDNYSASFARWVTIMLAVYLVSIYFLIQSLFSDESPITRLMLGGGMITFLPLFISLWQGQDTAFLFFGLTLWCVGMLKQNDGLAAAGLTLTSVRPHLCMALAIPFLFKYRSIFWRFVILATLAGIYSLLLVGAHGILGFISLIKISADRVGYGMNPQNMPNLTGVLYRSLLHYLDPNLLNLFSWIIFATGIVIIVLLWMRSKTIHEPLLGLTILIAAMFAPHLHAHDLTVLILPWLFAIHEPNVNENPPQVIILLPIVSFVFLLGLLVDSLYFIVPYIVSAALAWRLVTKLPATNKPLSPPTP